jgi:hypothetical protein
MKPIDAEAELTRLLQKAIDEEWEKTPIGYNETNNGYHMGKGLITNKEIWDKYCKELETRPDLKAYDFMVELVQKLAEKYNKEENDNG